MSTKVKFASEARTSSSDDSKNSENGSNTYYMPTSMSVFYMWFFSIRHRNSYTKHTLLLSSFYQRGN